MRSFSFLPSRLILVHPLQSHALLPFRPTSSSSVLQSHALVSFRPTSSSSTLQSHALLPFRPTSSPSALQSHALLPFRLTSSPSALQSHALLPFRPTSSPSAPPVTRPFTFPSHIIPVSPSSHMPFYLFISFNISSQLCVFSPLVLDPRGKCRVFRRKRFTFPRGRQGHWLHRPLSRHLPFPPPGKVPGFSAKTVHFPPRPTGALAPQASLAALGISTPGESAGFSCENGSLSPAADRGIGSTGLSRGTCRFYPWGKCRVFPRKRFTFTRGQQGYRLHRPLSRHLPFLPPGKVPGFSCENGSLSPAADRGTGSTGLSGGTRHSLPRGKCRVFPRKWFTFPRGMRLQGRSSRACLGKCLVYRHSEKEHLLDLG